jgi:outer membrane autotransporter protein
MNQQGGSLGLTGTLYKGNFFTALTASAGASAGEAYTSYGRDHFSMLTAGVANRTGYNWELAGGKLIIQPQVFLGYIFVNPFDYTSSSGVRISSDPLNTIQVAPGLKVICNTKNGWRPYASVDVMMNFMGHTKYRADETRLPELSVKPYVQYGVGVQKSWGERFTGFLQAMLRNGGRNGIVLSAGFRWAIGRDNSKNVNAAPKQKIVIKQLNRNGVKICKTGI